MKKSLALLASLYIFAPLLFPADEPDPDGWGICETEKNCPTSIETVWCEVDLPPNGICNKTEAPTYVICASLYPSHIPYDSERMDCMGGGTNPDGNNPEICDISDPLYWLYCDTFPAY